MKNTLFKLTAISLALFSANSFAEQNNPQPAQQAVEQAQAQTTSAEMVVDSLTGVNYEMDENGEFARIRAVGEAELEIGDRADIRTATQKALMRAKANIAKFLSERVTSEEVLENAQKMTSSTDGQNKQVSRESLETYMENIKNSADALLKGVIVTKTDVNKDQKLVQVEAGISKKTMAAADTLNKGLKTDSTENKNSPTQISIPLNDNGGGREIKKSKNYDNF